MPFYNEKKEELLQSIKKQIAGERSSVLEIGILTEDQHRSVNEKREAQGYPLLESPEVLYMGRHHVNSRHRKDGYNADDILAQIISVMSEKSIIPNDASNQTTINSTVERLDAYGNKVTDVGILELMAKKPKAELFSVIPKGDNIKPNDIAAQKKAS